MTDPLLAELEAVANASHPGWSSTLAAPISRERIEELLLPLGGWRPPDEVLALYEWHNGQVGDDEHCLWVPCVFLPLEQAVEMLVSFREMFPGWPPLLTIGYGTKTNLEVPLSRRSVKSQPLYLRDNEGAPFRAFNSLKGLLQASIECYRAGIFRWNDEYAFWEDRIEDDDSDNRRNEVRLRFNRGASPTAWDESEEEVGNHWINQTDASTWPKAWHAFIGFDAKAFEPRGATATVSDVVIDRVDWSKPVIIQGAIDVLIGGEGLRATISDGVQFLQVICRGALATGIVVGDRFEFELERRLDAEETRALAAEDEERDRAMRKALRDLMDQVEERLTGHQPAPDDLVATDFIGVEIGKANLPVFLAKRVALVERIARDDDDTVLEALEDLAEDEEPNTFAGHKPWKVAENVDDLAGSLLENYRNNYKLVQRYEPVDVAELEDFDARLYDRVTRTLAKLGHENLGDWEVANMRKIFPHMPRIAMRAFTDRVGIVGSLYTFPEQGWKSMIPPRKPPPDGIVDLVSAFGDGRYVFTTSAGDALKFDAPPQCLRECMPLGSRVEEVLTRHRERVAALSPPGKKPIAALTLEEHLKHVRQRHRLERAFHLGRVPTPAELVRLGNNPELAERVHAAMVRIDATYDAEK